MNQCGNGSGTNSEVIGKACLGPIMVAQIWDHFIPKDPMCVSYLNQLWAPYGSLHGTHVAPDRSHVGPISEPVWDSYQIHLQNLWAS